MIRNNNELFFVLLISILSCRYYKENSLGKLNTPPGWCNFNPRAWVNIAKLKSQLQLQLDLASLIFSSYHPATHSAGIVPNVTLNVN